MPESEFIFRPFVPEDRAFIESSWASSYYSACHVKDLLSPEEFHKFHRPLRERFFNRPTATVIVVASADDPNQILAWIAVEVLPNCAVIHYAYIKSAYRKEFGIFKELIRRGLPPGQVVVTHMTPKFARILSQPEFREFRFVPHLT
jgi:hypothetical protein